MLCHALEFYGGVPKAIVSDNLKSAVTRASRYEADINRSFKDFARHYNCVTNPTRGYSPQDKALVENAVHLAHQRIYYPLRNMTFFSLGELNKEIRKLLKQASRLELFQSIEKGHLKSLPTSVYQLKDYCRAKVQKMIRLLLTGQELLQCALPLHRQADPDPLYRHGRGSVL